MLTRNPTTTSHIPVRPLPVLASIITSGLKQVRQNVNEIAKAMVEARRSPGMTHTAFLAWSEKNFRLKRTQTLYYLDIGESGGAGHGTGSKKTKRNSKKKKKRTAQSSNGGTHSSYAATAALTQPEYQMGIDLIEAGFRTLAKTMHPDKGGSQSAMIMLNKVRGRLKTLWN